MDWKWIASGAAGLVVSLGGWAYTQQQEVVAEKIRHQQTVIEKIATEKADYHVIKELLEAQQRLNSAQVEEIKMIRTEINTLHPRQ